MFGIHGVAFSAEYNFYRNIWNPIYHGKLLNYCAVDQKECGLQLATHYCRLLGYDHADRAIIAYNTGCSNYIINLPVRLHARCCGAHCNSFKLIRCVNFFQHQHNALYYNRVRSFVYPRFNHQRIDWCYDGDAGCGYKAAFSFCRRMGYMQTKYYKIDNNINLTIAIGNQKLCVGTKCRGFTKIDCFR